MFLYYRTPKPKTIPTHKVQKREKKKCCTQKWYNQKKNGTNKPRKWVKKKEQILKIVEWLYNNEDWKESDYDKVYEKAVKMAHKHALEAIKWNNCEVSFYESPKRIASRMKCSVDTVRKFIKALKEIFGNTVHMKPDKAVKSMRYNPKLNNYIIALPDREEWKNIFARRFEKIKEGVSRIKDSVYYLKRVWFRKEKGYLWEDKEFNRIAKRSPPVS